MFIKIAPNKIIYNDIENGTDVLVKIESITSRGSIMVLTVNCYSSAQYASGTIKKGEVVGIKNTYEFESTQPHYETLAIKKLRAELLTDLGLIDADLTILAEATRACPDEIIRVSIPVDEAVTTAAYRAMLDNLMNQGYAAFLRIGNTWILYLNYITEADALILEADENVLIEYFPTT